MREREKESVLRSGVYCGVSKVLRGSEVEGLI